MFNNLKIKSPTDMDCKSTNNYVGKRHMTVQNSLRNGNEKQSKMITRSISHSVKRMPQQNICKGRSIKNEQFNKDVGKRSKSSLRGKSNSDTFEAKQCLSSTNHTKKSKSEISINRNLNIHIQDNSVESSNKMRLMHIEQSITDMQNKILKLEQKSVLDEEKINIFKMVVLKQRNNDIKMLLDEKENEVIIVFNLFIFVDMDLSTQNVQGCSLTTHFWVSFKQFLIKLSLKKIVQAHKEGWVILGALINLNIYIKYLNTLYEDWFYLY